MKNSSDSPSWLLSMTSLFPVKVGSEDMLGEGLGGGGRGGSLLSDMSCLSSELELGVYSVQL